MGYEIIDNLAIEMVKKEIRRQVQLQAEGRFRFTPKDNIPRHQKLAMLLEECGEVARMTLAIEGIVQESPDKDELEKELTQVAAIAIAWLEGELSELIQVC